MTVGPELELDYHDSVPVARLIGEVDLMQAGKVRERLLAALGNRDAGLVIDLTDARYIDSAGVNVMFDLAERLGARQQRLAVVVPAGGLVERVLSIVDLAAVASLRRTVDLAVETVRGESGASVHEDY